MIADSFALARYHIPLEAPLPVGKQRIELRQGLVLKASVGEQQHYVEIAPLSGLDRDGSPLNGFSHESVDEVIAEAQLLLQSVIEGGHDLIAASNLTQLPSLAWGLSLLAAKINGQLPVHHPEFEPIPLLVPREGEPLALTKQRIAALPAQIRRVKIKVAQTSMAEELALIYAVLEQRPELKLRLDANQGFEQQQAESFCACLPKAAIEYFEEPCRIWQNNRSLYASTGIPFALDETLAKTADFKVAEDSFEYGLRALVLKPMLLGTLQRLQRLIEEANALGIRCVLSSSLEASLGIRDLCKVAALLTPDETPGADTLSPFSKDLIVGDNHKSCLQFSALSPVFTIEN
ncbi:o-succinylbenzoate synthase [Shewanella dokdonensis]|uniref:o-succinylbenzoate synthase n=1 Tax=Shewanella dokdonensis TaxID=712036 RepID=UPI00200BB355|nr:o-succinylbenzoate synthase [Shewanella dokdonensis]MCL1075687.1 o-succinylbenzoate synthase [Shewanella dokdonensis]